MGKPVVTAFGKVRVEAEFVGVTEGPLQHDFARWLDEGIGHAMDKGGVTWRDLFQDCRPQAFIYRSPAKASGGSILLGVLGPSEDRFGRPFPFAVMTELRESSYASKGSILPVAAERFVVEAAELCRSAPSTRRASEPIGRAGDLRPPEMDECGLADQDFANWKAREGVLAEVWSLLFADAPVRAEACLRALIDAVVPVRSRSGLATCRAVRLPLGRGGAPATCFWLEVMRALAQWNRTIPAVFWPADRASGSALIQLGDVPSSSFVQLWSPMPEPAVVDLTLEGDLHSGPDVPMLSAGVAGVLADPRGRARRLFEELEKL
jgi:type VI secretion system ImpM family protein